MGELLARIDSRELNEWEAYELVAGPIGRERDDQLFAQLQATIANAQRSKKQRPYKAEQFVPRWGRRRPDGPMSGEDMLRTVKGLHRGMVDKGRGTGTDGDARRPAHQDRN